MITDPLFYALAIPAVILVGLSKGGFAGLAVLSLPLIGLAISPVQGAAIMLPILIFQDFISTYAYWRKWDVPNVRILLPASFVGVALGYVLAAELPAGAVEIVLGIIAAGFGIKSLLGKRAQPSGRLSRITGWICGVGGGFTSMIANTGAPLHQIFLMPQKLPRDIFVGTQQIIWTIINCAKIVPFLALNQLTPGNLSTALVLFPLALVSTLAGIWLVRRVSGEQLYTVIYWLLLPVGAMLVWQGVMRAGIL
ncbi:MULTISPECIES: sulfite exporter TauE/SafE family protein [unclassified Chelatococcus]|jgi:uncharacterized membrane protein YfcA|uniref:sulfite exporter TauE/SafE family protein n=1 Tax=unclassified Chelatococcus TaxID=2638111 RepID=UPI001BCC176A|nr:MULTISPECIES: sulfite exporter TauE/SafE family protein [unclassified Chelatococcus]CAH1662534.1 putative membrane transporter protein [Hyphomicrobiales bacterium]MBS7741391.1 sulfite exporter TauE/SafE family protein [Chelatococcus sp. HY11]MBX3546127.1 sulfite exporter TauE/SafE family protein [Chelatococcus sp.]MCO5077224.1 sulfite exporter TauE/SafE family protein [Chelatococcus sp.]CAH1682655.1 putative membrane transporter protein [Hyphomicrobiales bacterium]